MNEKYYSTKPTLREGIVLRFEVTDEVVNEIRADVIDECIKAVNDHCGGLPNPRIISCLEQLKEKRMSEITKTEIESVIGYGSACDGCKKCIKYKSRKCRGMSVTCFGFKADKK